MNKILGNMEEILEHHVSGFHQYRFGPSASLTYVSRNFCRMLGCAKEEFQNRETDPCAGFVHPSDRQVYADFLDGLSRREQTLTTAYRVMGKDGTVKYIQDTATSNRLDDGTMVAYSTWSDITPIQTRTADLQFLNETIPCGFVRYTCDKNPRITYFNEQMLKMLRLEDLASSTEGGAGSYLEMYRENVFLMIPMEERGRFIRTLERAYQGETVAGEMTLLRSDGTRARVYGWITRHVGEDGREEFQSVCMDITEKHEREKRRESERYLKALSDIYDIIFEYDFSARTVKCLWGQKSATFRSLEQIPMKLEEATENWIRNTVIEVDRERVLQFFRELYRPDVREREGQPPQIRYRALSSDGSVKTYGGIFLKIDPSVSFFCCRNLVEEQETDQLRHENVSLKHMNENMQEFVVRFTDGIIAFEVDDDHVKPLYASDNVCQFFGYTKEEWRRIAQEKPTIKDFVSRSSVEYEAFMDLFRNGEAEFEYIDTKTRLPHRIKAVCSHMYFGSETQRYVMLYSADDNQRTKKEEPAGSPAVSIRTFGYFDVFVDGKPIAFRNEKSKELFALLVDRRGGYGSSEEAIGFLWEEESANSVTLARYRKVALRLKNILEEYGISDIVESVNGRRRIAVEKVRCDLFDYLSGREEHAQLFKGSYLTNYSWGETTLGELWQHAE